MKHLTRIILVAFVLVSVMPAVADTANERISQWKKDRLSEARDSEPGSTLNAQGTGADDSQTWSREEGTRFNRDARAFDNDRFPWAAPGLVPNNPNGATSQSQSSDAPTGDDADGWWWSWFSHWWNERDFGDDDSSDDHSSDDGSDFGDDDSDSSDDHDASPH